MSTSQFNQASEPLTSELRVDTESVHGGILEQLLTSPPSDPMPSTSLDWMDDAPLPPDPPIAPNYATPAQPCRTESGYPSIYGVPTNQHVLYAQQHRELQHQQLQQQHQQQQQLMQQQQHQMLLQKQRQHMEYQRHLMLQRQQALVQQHHQQQMQQMQPHPQQQASMPTYHQPAVGPSQPVSQQQPQQMKHSPHFQQTSPYPPSYPQGSSQPQYPSPTYQMQPAAHHPVQHQHYPTVKHVGQQQEPTFTTYQQSFAASGQPSGPYSVREPEVYGRQSSSSNNTTTPVDSPPEMQQAPKREAFEYTDKGQPIYIPFTRKIVNLVKGMRLPTNEDVRNKNTVHIAPDSDEIEIKAPIGSDIVDEGIWATILAYEYSTRLGGSFKAKPKTIQVDGGCDIANPYRMCLSAIGNGSRVAGVVKIRAQIGKGLEMSMRDGSVFITCVGESPIFVQCPNLANRAQDPPATVYRLAGRPNASVEASTVKPPKGFKAADMPKFLQIASDSARKSYVEIETNHNLPINMEMKAKMAWAVNTGEPVLSAYIDYVNEEKTREEAESSRITRVRSTLSAAAKKADTRVREIMSNGNITKTKRDSMVANTLKKLPKKVYYELVFATQ